MSTKGIDLSAWNGSIDFSKVKKAGIDFVILRSGFGRLTSQKDNRFEEYYAGAKKAGLKIGSYWYSYAKSVAEARIEAAACLACVKGKKFDLPIYFDMEESSQFYLGRNACTAMALAFCEEIEKGGYKAGVYSNTNWFANVLDKPAIAKKYSIWHAQWSSVAVTNCEVWQYSDSGKVSGINGNVDMNICYKSFGAAATPAKTTTSTTAQKKTVATLVKEVLAGKWGNGDDRKKRLTEAGYNYAEVQAAVNKQLAGTTTKKKIEKGGKVRVKNPVIYGSTKKFAVYYDKYDVLEVSGDRVVIGIGKAVTAAVKASNLEAV